MRRVENALEILSPIVGIVILILFHYLFPEVVKNKPDFLLLIGLALSFYGVSLIIVSRSYIKNFKEAPILMAKLRESLEELGELRDAQMILPAEVCLRKERAVRKTVHVLTHDLSWNIDEEGTPKLMFETIASNLGRGIHYEYIVSDASEGTRQNLELLRQRLEETLKEKSETINNFHVRFVASAPLLFSFALFDMDLPGRENNGFILVHTLDVPMAIPMNLATFKQARDVLNSIG